TKQMDISCGWRAIGNEETFDRTSLHADTLACRGYLRAFAGTCLQNARKYAPLRPATTPVRRFTKRLYWRGSRASADAQFWNTTTGLPHQNWLNQRMKAVKIATAKPEACSVSIKLS
ncbi:MAG: hypothetical protein IJ268_12330, partial [Proteobacteria bacterium]|nr:hypothetical protein [Pseudomonadota bacterium]